MSDTQTQSPLTAALEKIGAALDRLDSKIQQKSVKNGHDEREKQHLTLVVGENKQLQEEQVRLNQAIDDLQNQYDDLHKVAVNIYGRLDDSVRRITKIIGN